MNQWVFLNSDFVSSAEAKLSFRDLSIQRGYGIFDFFRIHNSIPVFLEDHLDRFFTSAESMHLSLVYSRDELKTLINELISKNNIVNSGIRLTLTGGPSPDGYSLAEPSLIIAQQHFQPCTKEQFEKGIKLMTYPYQRQLSHVKTIDYLMAIHLQPKLKAAQADDILYHSNNEIRECPRANIFFVMADKTIVTPSLGILKGITRKKLLGLSNDEYKIEERDISVEEMYSSKEAFITSSTKQVLPVKQIDEHIYSKHNEVTKALDRMLQEVIHEYSAVGAE